MGVINEFGLRKFASFITCHDPRYGPKYAASSKNGKLFLADFSDFYLAVSASVNDSNYRRPNSFITPMTRDMDRKMLPAEKVFLADFY